MTIVGIFEKCFYIFVVSLGHFLGHILKRKLYISKQSK